MRNSCRTEPAILAAGTPCAQLVLLPYANSQESPFCRRATYLRSSFGSPPPIALARSERQLHFTLHDPREKGQLMLPGLLSSTNIPVLQQVVNFAQARHGVLAGNIANINTPGYRTRDLSVEVFEERLKTAIAEANRPGHGGRPISAGDLPTSPEDPMRKVSDAMTNLLYHDDTNIDLEQQITEINKNQYLHSMALSIMTNQMELLQSAISERV